MDRLHFILTVLLVALVVTWAMALPWWATGLSAAAALPLYVRASKDEWQGFFERDDDP